MDPLTISTTVALPREAIFEYLSDISNHAEFEDHYLTDWHLTRVESRGRGAGARFRVEMPARRYSWADLTLVELEPPYRIVGRGRTGKNNRVRLRVEYRLTIVSESVTQVALTIETDPVTVTDRLAESFGARRWLQRKSGKALARLRSILEEGKGSGKRATVAGTGSSSRLFDL